ncbi:MAG: hypothetical protein COX07_03530 [Bacteroidetes bacterium CG23_combo_of_CG06-09_8_20_14_all_32_9]|nr:MAG: hypothetical protein COX07_03530 [Bacteroidetes bacterium CG23_combo_of_CG06-09_8_20_14_all_32_9]
MTQKIMTTLRVTVYDAINAYFLSVVLHTMRFVKKVEEEFLSAKYSKQTTQFQNLKKLLNSVKKGEMFKEIKDPVQWQKSLRNEWE